MCRMYSPVVNFNAPPPLNIQFVRLIPFYLSLPTVGPYWLRFGAQTSQALEKKIWTLTPSHFAAGSQHVLARRHGSWQRTRIVAGTAQWGKVSDARDGYNGCISCNVSKIHFMVCLNLNGIEHGQTEGKKCSDPPKIPTSFWYVRM